MSFQYLNRFSVPRLFQQIANFAIITFSFSPFLVHAQWDMDTLRVAFPEVTDSSHISDLTVRVVDAREQRPHVIGMYEKTKYYLIPVDLQILLDQPLSECVQDFFQRSSVKSDSCMVLAIHHFEVTVKSSSLIIPRFQLNASIKAFQKTGEDSTYLGEWVYETTAGKSYFSGNLRKGFQSLLRKWQKVFISDWQKCPYRKTPNQKRTITRFRPWDYSGKPMYMVSGGEICLGSHFFTTDFSIYFSERSGKNPTVRSGGYHLRYRKEDDFESIEWGLSVDRWLFRKHPFWVFQIKSGLFFGVNKWEDIAKREHELYDAVLLEWALNQSLTYMPLDQQSVTLGIGLSESVNYIYSKKLRFQFGILFHLGLQL